jgi:hypothetical protein
MPRYIAVLYRYQHRGKRGVIVEGEGKVARDQGEGKGMEQGRKVGRKRNVPQPNFDITEYPSRCALVPVAHVGILIVESESSDPEGAFVFGVEFRSLRPVGNEEVGGCGDKDCEEAF